MSSLNFFELHLAETGPVNVIITDDSGRLIREVLDERMTAGNHVIHLVSENLKAGLYFLMIRNNQENQMIRFSVTA